MAFRIMKPGIFTDMAASDYFADPCPSPSLTQSIAKVLIDRSPLHVWHANPRLNLAYEPNDSTRFDLGNMAHYHLIGRGKDFVIIDAADWRTKDARAARDKAHADGKIGVLRDQFQRAGDMAEAALDQLASMGLADQWRPDAGHGEAVIAWQEGDVWLRSMIDWLSVDYRIVWDFKTTRESAAPYALGSKMANDGWCIQAAMHERGLNVLDPQNAGRRKHRFVCQECEPPYALTVSELPEREMTIGRKQLAYAFEVWRRCIETERWPGYAEDIQRPSLPAWAETRWLEREVAHAEAGIVPSDLIMAG